MFFTVIYYTPKFARHSEKDVLVISTNTIDTEKIMQWFNRNYLGQTICECTTTPDKNSANFKVFSNAKELRFIDYKEVHMFEDLFIDVTQ